MRSLFSARIPRVSTAVLVALVLVIGSTATVAARKPSPNPPPPSPTITIAIAPTGTLEPSGEYGNVDVTVTCPIGWTWSYGRLYVLRGSFGGAGTFSVACTGTPQAGHARIVNGNRFQLGDWTATAYVGITKSGQQATSSRTQTIQLQPGVTVRIADQGQLTGTSGGGVSLAVAVACPIGATGQPSSLTVSQGTAIGSASFTPTCDRFSHTLVLPIAASQGTFQTGGAIANASVSVGWNGGSFSGADSRAIALLESSTGDATPPSTPANVSAQLFGTGDGETELTWTASTDNATPSTLLTYEIYLNGQFDQGIGGGLTKATLYSQVGALNTIEVIAVDGAGNKSAPASVIVDLRP
jgi:hypothetical protein